MKTPTARYFQRREDYAERHTPAESLFRKFLVRCFTCDSFQVRPASEDDEETGELAVWMICRKCNQRERLKL